MAHPGGRPIEYTPEIVTKARAYIDECEDEDIQRVKMANEEKGYETFENKLKVKLPTIEGLAIYLGIHKDTIYDWETKYAEFSDVISDLRAKQADKLINSGLSGDYNPTIAKVLLSKHGYREGIDTDHTTKGEKLESSDEIKKLAEQLNEIKRNNT